MCSSCNPYNGTFSNYDSRQKAIADSNIVLKENNRIAETKPVDDDQQKIIQGNQARGIDSLVGIKKERAMPIISKYNYKKFPGQCYPSIKEILRIEHFMKWSHLATVYIFIDSTDRICKMNYFFKDISSTNTANFKDSLLWSLEDTYEYIESPPTGMVYEDNPNPRGINHLLIVDSTVGINWEDRYSSRRLFHLRTGKILYSVASLKYIYTYAHDLESIRANMSEPVLDTQK